MSYADYVDTESKTNVRKFALTSLTADEVTIISDFYKAERKQALSDDHFFALCQGVRNGAEIRAFAKRLGRRVLGTDISSTILQVPDGVLCDFSHCPDLWRGKVDFLYSNSYDHAADLDATLAEWHALLSSRGLLFLQFTPAHQNDTGLTFEALTEKLTKHSLAIDATLPVESSTGIRRVSDVCLNSLRQVRKRLVRPLVSKSRKLHWSIGYTLRHGPLIDTKVIVAHR